MRLKVLWALARFCTTEFPALALSPLLARTQQIPAPGRLAIPSGPLLALPLEAREWLRRGWAPSSKPLTLLSPFKPEAPKP